MRDARPVLGANNSQNIKIILEDVKDLDILYPALAGLDLQEFGECERKDVNWLGKPWGFT